VGENIAENVLMNPLENTRRAKGGWSPYETGGDGVDRESAIRNEVGVDGGAEGVHEKIPSRRMG